MVGEASGGEGLVGSQLVGLMTQALSVPDPASRSRKLRRIWRSASSHQKRVLLSMYYWDLYAIAARDQGTRRHRHMTELQAENRRYVRRRGVLILLQIALLMAVGLVLAVVINRMISGG
jgi:hypothetical protein